MATSADRVVVPDPKQPAIILTGLSDSSHLSSKLGSSLRCAKRVGSRLTKFEEGTTSMLIDFPYDAVAKHCGHQYSASMFGCLGSSNGRPSEKRRPSMSNRKR